ncbi:TonB family protein [Candidatus Palauibacter sp.]|uniref:TonB family protein n=1 Tax=Candidatus Palauibacter sp. TaxID=3101350 RepID=UPI003CC66C26
MPRPVNPAYRARRRGPRVLAVILATPAIASCFLPRMMQPPEPMQALPAEALPPRSEVEPEQEPPETTEQAPPPAPEEPEEGFVSPVTAAIIDSIEAAVADSIEGGGRDSVTAVSREAGAAARRDSMLAAARRISRSVAARRDSLAAAGRRDSATAAAAALRDSTTAGRRDSLATATRGDSLAAAQRDSIAAAALRDSAAGPDAETELEQLRASGPTYISYDEGPRLVWDTEAEALLATTLLPVIRAEDLDAGTAANLWLLVRADGRVDAIVVQTSSDNTAFDSAAERAARALIFAPALRDGRAVPLWILREISLLMR